MLLLERLSDARRNGHRVLAVVRGTAVNQDGASNGLTAPNGPSQQRVIRQALANAGLPPADVDAVEAHGTGTTLGDPIEAQALLATYGQDRPTDRPLWLGSVKSNIGHTQAAAGVGRRDQDGAWRCGTACCPRTLHVDEPTPHVDWSAGAVRAADRGPAAGRRPGDPRRAAVSSFGISGTNAHVILEQAPAGRATAAPVEPAAAPPVGAAGCCRPGRRPALRRRRPAGWPGVPGRRPRRAGWTSGSRWRRPGRAASTGRWSAPAGDGLLAGLDALAAAAAGAGRSRPVEPVARRCCSPVRVRSGPGWAVSCTAAFPVFAAAFDEVCAAFGPLLRWSLREVMFADRRTGLLDQTGFTQPALFAVEVALFRLVESWGLRPDSWPGTRSVRWRPRMSPGCCRWRTRAGLVAARGRLMQALPAGGAMWRSPRREAEVLPLLPATVGCRGGERAASVVVSGDRGAGRGVAGRLAARGRRRAGCGCQPRVPFAADGADAGRVRARSLERLAYRRAGGIAGGVDRDRDVAGDEELALAGYWVRQVRGAVRFADAVAALRGARGDPFLEIGPGRGADRDGRGDCVERRRPRSRVAAPRTGDEADDACSTAPGQAYVARRRPVDWAALFGGRRARRPVDLPTYAFQRQRYWLDAPAGAGDAAGRRPGLRRPPAARRGRRRSPTPTACVLTGRLSARPTRGSPTTPCCGAVSVPGTGFVELALRAGDAGRLRRTVDELTLRGPAGAARTRRGRRSRSSSAPADETGRRHGRGLLPASADSRRRRGPATPPACSPPAGAPPRRRPRRVAARRRASRSPLDGLYDRLADAATPTARPSRACARPGGAATSVFAEVGAARAAGGRRRRSACTPRCSTPPCTPLGLPTG